MMKNPLSDKQSFKVVIEKLSSCDDPAVQELLKQIISAEQQLASLQDKKVANEQKIKDLYLEADIKDIKAAIRAKDDQLLAAEKAIQKSQTQLRMQESLLDVLKSSDFEAVELANTHDSTIDSIEPAVNHLQYLCHVNVDAWNATTGGDLTFVSYKTLQRIQVHIRLEMEGFCPKILRVTTPNKKFSKVLQSSECVQNAIGDSDLVTLVHVIKREYESLVKP